MDAGQPNTRNRIWTTGSSNNGFLDENLQQQPLPLQRLQTPGKSRN